MANRLGRVLLAGRPSSGLTHRQFPVRQFYRSSTKPKKPMGFKKSLLLGVSAGAAFGAGLSYYNYATPSKPTLALLNSPDSANVQILADFPQVKISRRVDYPHDNSGLQIVLFQYTTCPFCCKVRSFLDFNGLSYGIVEVNPVLRQQLSWSSYRKVPILLIKTEEGWLQLNDSSMIISCLTSYLHDKEMKLKEVANCYPTISYLDDSGNKKSEILNRYFLMYQGNVPADSTKETVTQERTWRKWADDVLVHALSPNIYRSKDEALQAFNWFSEVGNWEEHFSSWERQLVIYVGATAMYFIGKRLKKRHNLKSDVRQSLYDDCNTWLRELNRMGTPYHGGAKPNLADLAVYGVLNSIEGCQAFTDLLRNTKVGAWYQRMKHLVSSQAGSSPVVMAAS